MSKIAGFFHPETDFSFDKNVVSHALDSMNQAFSFSCFQARSVKLHSFLTKNLGLIQTENEPGSDRPLPIIKKDNGCTFAIVWDGELYNASELAAELTSLGHTLEYAEDGELALTTYLAFGPSFAEKLNGAFAFAIADTARNRLLLYRDRAGTKPLFYCVKDGILLFASQLKGLFAWDCVKPVLDLKGLNEVFSLGPAKTSGSGVFKDIFEVLPAHFLLYSPEGLSLYPYWELKSHPHEDSYEKTIEKTAFLIQDSVKRQLDCGSSACSFLSGGVDSSLVSAICARELKKKNRQLTTFSFDFTGNDKNFQANEFQPSQDRPFVEIMAHYLQSDHHFLECTAKTQFDLLEASVLAHDLPAMADVDSSLLYFCSQVAPDFSAALTGECADEIFGGYPWFHKEACFCTHTFPWTMDLKARQILLSDSFLSELHMEEYVQERYETSLSQVPRLDDENPRETRRREISYLNLVWFMQTLLDRMNRTSEICGLTARVPFADHRIVEYLWNVPWEMKAGGGIVKNLLRQSGRGLLPDEVLFRKKSPYPKTYDKAYEKLLSQRLTEILEDPGSPILPFIDKEKTRLFLSSPSDYGKPWYGQLMAAPQMMAYMIQINFWLSYYQPELHL